MSLTRRRPMTLSLPEPTIDRINQLAASQGRSRSSAAGKILADGLSGAAPAPAIRASTGFCRAGAASPCTRPPKAYIQGLIDGFQAASEPDEAPILPTREGDELDHDQDLPDEEAEDEG